MFSSHFPYHSKKFLNTPLGSNHVQQAKRETCYRGFVLHTDYDDTEEKTKIISTINLMNCSAEQNVFTRRVRATQKIGCSSRV